MIAAVFLAIALAVLWMVFLVIQFIAALSLIALVVGLVVTASAYGFSFLGFYYIFGPPNIGWAIFAAMFLGTVIVRALLAWVKRAFGDGKKVIDERQVAVYRKSTRSPIEVNGSPLVLKGKYADRT